MKAMFFTCMPMFVCLFWSVLLAVELITGRRRSVLAQCSPKARPRMHLLAFMLTAVVLYFGHCVFFNHNTDILPLSDTLYCMANLSVYPLYYFFICSLTMREKEREAEQWLRYLLLLPAVIVGIMVGTLYVLMPQEEASRFIDQYLYQGHHTGLGRLMAYQVFAHDLCKVVFAFLIIPVFFYGRRHMQRYEELVSCTYADIEQKSLASLHYMFIAFVVTSVLSFTANIIGRHQFDESSWTIAIPSTTFSALLFAIGYTGYHQQFSIHDIELDEQQADAAVPVMSSVKELRMRIERLMEKEELFRQPNFKIVDLVQKLGTNRNYIYQAVNREMGISFNEYVNRMRIDYAAQLISEHPTMPLNEVSEQSGFSSSTSFYRNFKLFKGVGPKEYQSQAKE